MALVNTDAVVIRSYNLAEADRIVVLLTREAGLVRGVARGARRMKSRFGAALEPFTVLRLSFYEKENRELVTLGQVDILKSQFQLATQPELTEVLAYISEMVGEFAPPHEANDKFFRMVVACLDALRNRPDSSTRLLRYFEVWLLRLSGLFPDIRRCAVCGRTVPAETAAYFDFEGSVRCANCRQTSAASLSVTTQQAIGAILEISPSEFVLESTPFPIIANEELGDLTHRLIVRALDRRPRSMAVSPQRGV